MELPYHKFVNTTPKPSATKKSKGELGPPPAPCVGEGEADEVVEVPAVEDADVVDMMELATMF